ncbi:MAG TPA: DUF6457 domain-containing protein, partial [Jatrophihabitantaceae bacterium]
MTNPLDAWVHDLADTLDVDPAAVDVTALLDIARDAAHGVARPAAPLTTFLVGLAAGHRGGTPEAVAAAADIARNALASRDPALRDERLR